jgi:hypothetical protein
MVSVADEALSDDAVAAAAHLSNLVHALAQRAAASEARVRELEDKSATHDAVAAAIADIPEPSVDSEQLGSIEHMLEQLIQNPRDIEVLMQVGKQAGDLSTIVTEYSRLRDALQRVSDAAG